MASGSGDLPNRHRRTLRVVFEEPTRSDVRWDDILSLLRALEAELSEGRGSRLRVALRGVRAVFHRPHPSNEASRSLLRSVRRFLEEAGVRPEGR